MPTTAKLTFGGINLIGTSAELAANGYRFEALGDDTDWGNPEPIEDKIISWLQDGSIVALKNYDNRELNIRVRIVGTNLNKLALAEQALMLETGKGNLLTWTPPDGTAAPCGFSVVTSSLDFAFDDLAENRDQRSYALRIVAEPFVRSLTLATVTKTAPTGTQVITSIDPCTSAANWTKEVQVPPSANVSSAASTDGARVFATVTNTAHPNQLYVGLKRVSLAANLAGTPYIRVQLSELAAGLSYTPTNKQFMMNGVSVAPAAVSGNTYWFDASVYGITTLTSFQVTMTYSTNSATNSVTIGVDDLSRSNVLGDVSTTTREIARTLAVAGSARTQGNLMVNDATNALGDTLVYTNPTRNNQVAPNLRVWLATGNAQSTDATTVSGFTSDLSVMHGFDIPITGLDPGGHLLLARIKHASSGARTLTWAAKSRMNSIDRPEVQSGTTTVTLVAGDYSIVTVAPLNLPPTAMGSRGSVRIELTASAGVTLDEAWVFNIETGRLTQVACGTTPLLALASSNYLFLDAPSVESPKIGAYRGQRLDRTDSTYLAGEAASLALHEFIPPLMNIFTVTTNATTTSVTLSHYPRFHTHVAV